MSYGTNVFNSSNMWSSDLTLESNPHMKIKVSWSVPLFSSLRALKLGYLTQDMIDDYEPGLMFTIPRLAIVW